MYHALYINFPSNYRLKCPAIAVRNNLGINLTIPLNNPKNNHFTCGTQPPNSINSSGSEITLINFNFLRKWRQSFTIIGNYLSYLQQFLHDTQCSVCYHMAPDYVQVLEACLDYLREELQLREKRLAEIEYAMVSPADELSHNEP